MVERRECLFIICLLYTSSNTIYATGILNEDNSFKEILEKSLARLRPLQIGRAGQLMEWNDDFDLNAEDIRHRHVSHLFALHPGREIIPFEHKELAEAAKRSLQIRGCLLYTSRCV